MSPSLFGSHGKRLGGTCRHCMHQHKISQRANVNQRWSDRVHPRRVSVLGFIGVRNFIVFATTGSQEGMRAGCDDYLANPYAFAEVLARLEALGRRADRACGLSVLRVADLELDTQARRVSRGGQAIRLQHREFLLLEYVVRHVGQVVTRTMLLEATWQYDFEPRGNIIDMHVHRLSQKVDVGFSWKFIHTVAGAGYMVRAPSDSDGTVMPRCVAQIRHARRGPDIVGQSVSAG